MALFRRKGTSDGRSTRDVRGQLKEWASTRQGVEAFVEPQTSVTGTTVLLVAGDGEWVRRQVPSAQAAADFARKAGIPVYDTNRVGYPQRMRDYNLRQQGRTTSSPRSGPSGGSAPASGAAAASAAVGRSPMQREAIATLQSSAGASSTDSDPSEDELRKLWRSARSRSHPDRRGGDRTEWDEVEQAARDLGLADD